MRKIVIGCLFLSSCMVGPKYSSPETAFESAFLEEEPMAGPEVGLNTWWQQFDDPVLNEMIDEAIQNNYDLKIAAARIAEARAEYNLAAANLWPEIDVNGTALRQRISQNLFNSNSNNSTFSPGTLGSGSSVSPIQDFFQIGFDTSWEIDFWGRLRSLKYAAIFDLEASWENMRGVYITLLAEVARNYADFRAFQELIGNTVEQIEVGLEQLVMADVRYEAGLKAEIEPLQVKAQLDALRSSLPPLEASMKQSLYAIAVLLGRQPESLPESWIEERPIPQAAGKIPVGVPSDLLRRRPDIRQAERLIAAASSLVAATVAKLYPTISLTAAFGAESVGTNNWFTMGNEIWSVGPAVFWPFIDFGRIRAQIDFQKAEEQQALMTYEQTVLNALEEVEDALVAYFKEVERGPYLGDQEKDLKASRSLTRVQFDAGLASLSDVLAADNQVLSTELTWIASRQAAAEDLMAVYKALGGDWECSYTP